MQPLDTATKPIYKRKNFSVFRYLGPGILVTVGFIDPGNWAANLAAGSEFGYSLLWMVTLSTIMLIMLQHNSAHLGIATGYCLSENSARHLKPFISRGILLTAMGAAISTALAEILGGAIAINMLFGVPIKVAMFGILGIVILTLFFNTYKRIEKLIILFVAIIALSFFYETTLFSIDWEQVGISTITPSFPEGSLLIIVSVLGAVVMPHNLFLHSEIIQSRKWYLRSAKLKKKLLRYEFLDTLISMLLGWIINSVIIILAAEVFFKNNVLVTELSQAADLLTPILGGYSGVAFAIALLFCGVASSITAGMAGGTIFSGLFQKEYDETSKTTKAGVLSTLIIATLIILFIDNPLKGLIYSQMILSIQLPFTIFLQVYLTSSKKVMGEYANTKINNVLLISCGLFVSVLNILLLISIFKGGL
ncbi:Divalent metal cation transporter MntH [Candidatus Hepatincolaceae symbiont of Richtersius coronifer]